MRIWLGIRSCWCHKEKDFNWDSFVFPSNAPLRFSRFCCQVRSKRAKGGLWALALYVRELDQRTWVLEAKQISPNVVYNLYASKFSRYGRLQHEFYLHTVMKLYWLRTWWPTKPKCCWIDGSVSYVGDDIETTGIKAGDSISSSSRD